MRNSKITETIQTYLEELCVNISNRHVGSEGNRAATAFFAQSVAAFGFETECPEFECIDWVHGDVHLQANGETFRALVSPYSLSCSLVSPLVDVSTLDDLEKTDISGKILLIRDALAKEQLMPKNFPFYNPESHQKIVSLLENGNPAAIIAATERNPELVGGLYPFPLIEDGDFDIPSVYMTEKEGLRLAQYRGTAITLEFESRRIPSRGYNVIARKGADVSPKIVFCAHVDTKKNTPGALDNAAGVVTLMALAELLADYSGNLCVEIVALNGEDYYAAPGQIHYLSSNEATMEQVLLAVNLDMPGYHGANTAFSLFGCPDAMAGHIRDILGSHYGLDEIAPWYQSDHMIFVLRQRPAIAITSENFAHLMRDITHTEKDSPDLVDYQKLADVAYGLRDIARVLGQRD